VRAREDLRLQVLSALLGLRRDENGHIILSPANQRLERFGWLLALRSKFISDIPGLREDHCHLDSRGGLLACWLGCRFAAIPVSHTAFVSQGSCRMGHQQLA
jgi:hypothetical protein